MSLYQQMVILKLRPRYNLLNETYILIISTCENIIQFAQKEKEAGNRTQNEDADEEVEEVDDDDELEDPAGPAVEAVDFIAYEFTQYTEEEMILRSQQFFQV